MAALRIAGDEQLAVVGVAGGQAVGQRRAGRRQRVDDVLRLRIGVEVGVVRQRRRVVAGVVRGHHDVAVGGEERPDHRALGPAFVGGVGDVGDVVRLGDRGAVRVDQDRARAGAAGATGGRHDRARGGGRFALAAHRLVVEVVEIDAAGRRAGQRDELLALRGRAQLRGQVGRVERRDAQRRRFDQRAGRGAGVGGAARTAAAAPGQCGCHHGGRANRNRRAHRCLLSVLGRLGRLLVIGELHRGDGSCKTIVLTSRMLDGVFPWNVNLA